MIHLQLLRCAGGFHWECGEIEYLMEIDWRMMRRAEVSAISK